MIGFICAGVVAIAFLVARSRKKVEDPDEEPMLNDGKLYDLEDMDTSSDEGTLTTLSAGAVDHLAISNNKTIPFGNVGEAEIGDEIDSREGAEPLASVVEEENLFDKTLDNASHATPPTTPTKPHFCSSPLCETCCGTVCTPQEAGCCMITSSSPCARNNSDMERPYYTPDTIEF